VALLVEQYLTVPTPSMSKPLPILRPTSHEAIVALYIVEKRREAERERERQYYAGLPTVEKVARQTPASWRTESSRRKLLHR